MTPAEIVAEWRTLPERIVYGPSPEDPVDEITVWWEDDADSWVATLDEAWDLANHLGYVYEGTTPDDVSRWRRP